MEGTTVFVKKESGKLTLVDIVCDVWVAERSNERNETEQRHDQRLQQDVAPRLGVLPIALLVVPQSPHVQHFRLFVLAPQVQKHITHRRWNNGGEWCN